MSRTTADTRMSRPVVVTEAAREALLGLAQPDTGAERPALFVTVTGEDGGEYQYGFEWRGSAEVADSDLVADCEEFVVVVPAADAPRLTGATVDADPQFGMVITNPNTPRKPDGLADAPADSAQAEELRTRIDRLFAETVNPALASHSGAIKLERIEDGVLYVSLLGGCQGCSGAALTLQDGIERFIVETMPEIHKVVDVTDHGAGTMPFLTRNPMAGRNPA
ncbi:NifU family protein [Streptomyces blastmyceticus]